MIQQRDKYKTMKCDHWNPFRRSQPCSKGDDCECFEIKDDPAYDLVEWGDDERGRADGPFVLGVIAGAFFFGMIIGGVL